MSNGPGKYDDACTAAREATGAQAILLIVFDGDLGTGFSVQSHDRTILERVPAVLENVASTIREDLAGS